MGRDQDRWRWGWGGGAVSWLLGGGLAMARVQPPAQDGGQRTCPATVERVMPLLLRDLPGYVNRLALRSRDRPALPIALDRINYAILASQPEFTPLPIASSEYASPADAQLKQVFFTVLERQYSRFQVSEFQHYHWLFLAETQQGWQLALLFSRLGPFPANAGPLTPPRDTTQGLTAAAIRLWLRDCRAGAVKP